MTFFIAISVISTTIFLFFGAFFILFLMKRFFHIDGASYKKSLTVLFLMYLAGFILNALFGLFGQSVLSGILTLVLVFFIFHIYSKRYYGIDLLVSFKIYSSFLILLGLISVLAVILIRSLFVMPFIVGGDAMSPAYKNGDYLIINKLDKQIQRGDVVIYKRLNQRNEQEYLIKRVVGIPGEKVTIEEGKVFIDGKEFLEPYAMGQTLGKITVDLKNDQYFMLGDNRMQSVDSRVFGPVSFEDIEGKVFYKSTF